MSFSVLMSVYAKESPKALKIALRSILKQTYPPSEIIIVKDGALTPELEKVIQGFAINDIRFVVVPLKSTKGLGIALNAGLKMAKYELVARMDSDDVSIPDRFEKQITFLEQHPTITLLSSNIIEYDITLKKKLSIKKVPESDEEIKKSATLRNPFNHMAAVYKKSNVLAAGGYIHCPNFEDYYLWLRMISKGGTYYNIQENLIHARGGAEMLSRRGGSHYAKAVWNFYTKAVGENLLPKKVLWTIMPLRIAVALVPKNMRATLYRKSLRERA